LWLKSKLYPY